MKGTRITCGGQDVLYFLWEWYGKGEETCNTKGKETSLARFKEQDQDQLDLGRKIEREGECDRGGILIIPSGNNMKGRMFAC